MASKPSSFTIESGAANSATTYQTQADQDWEDAIARNSTHFTESLANRPGSSANAAGAADAGVEEARG
eukprot:5727233-Prorocentrum_lima.AAC.1